MKASSANTKRVALVLTPNLPSTLQASLTTGSLEDKETFELQMLLPKSKRAIDDDYYSSGSSRKGSCIINIKLPHRGSAAGINYEVKEIDNGDILSICEKKIKMDQIGLLQDNNSAAYSKTVQELLNAKSDGKYPPALDPVKGMLLPSSKIKVIPKQWTTSFL